MTETDNDLLRRARQDASERASVKTGHRADLEPCDAWQYDDLAFDYELAMVPERVRNRPGGGAIRYENGRVTGVLLHDVGREVIPVERAIREKLI